MIDFMELAAQCAPQVHVTTLASVVLHESGANPYAVGVNGGVKLPRQPRNKAEAIATAEWLKANGYNFDGGLGQVNVRNLEWLGMSISDLFDPCANLRGAAIVLTDCYKRASVHYEAGQPALQAALSCYNTGNFSAGFSNGYVMKVAANATLQVPALVPRTKDARAPVRLQASQPGERAAASKTAKEIAPDDGMPDAFGKKKRDAFSEAASKEAEGSVN